MNDHPMSDSKKLSPTKTLLLFLRPFFDFTLFRNKNKISDYQNFSKKNSTSSMVEKFNFTQAFFQRFFRKVSIVDSDITEIKKLSQKGPIIFVMKNRGQLEYRYFNYLFLKNKISLITYSNKAVSVFWRPWKEVWAFLMGRFSLFFHNPQYEKKSPEDKIVSYLKESQNILLSLRISRDYLFGLFETNPTKPVLPLLKLQNAEQNLNLHIVPIQFLYDKDPEKPERSFFDFFFGEKSCPGTTRKFLLFLMSYYKQPQAKFGKSIALKDFLETHKTLSETETASQLLKEIEDNLSIERARITGPKLIQRTVLLQEIIKEEKFQETLSQIAKETGQSLNYVQNKAKRYLNEIAAGVNYSYLHLISLLLDSLLENIYDGLIIKHEQLNKIRELVGTNPVVLVPMHRSHLDYLLISHMFYRNNISFPHVCAGKNLNFWPVGHFIRKCGGFFIRRNFEGNTIYKETVAAYLKTLLKKKYSLEFFIEGTRSRTGKMLKPKLGILGQILRAYHDGACEDISFVPIAISYDQIMEQKTYQAESQGSEKQRESARKLLKARKALQKRYGKVYLEFAKPVSLKSFYEEKNLSRESPFSELRPAIQDFGYHLTYLMNKSAIVTPTAMVALAILSLKRKTFSFQDLMKRISLLKEYLDYKDVNYSDPILYSDVWAYGQALEVFQSKNYVQEIKTFEESFYSLTTNNLVQVDYYKNNIVHFFVSLTCFCKILNQMKIGEELSLSELAKKFEILKTIFSFDFTFSSREPVEEHLKRVMIFCEEKGLIQTSHDFQNFSKIENAERTDYLSSYLSLLDNYLECRLIVLRYIRSHHFEKMETKEFIKDILEKAKPLYLKETYHHPEALTRFNLESSFHFLIKVGILKTATSKNKDYYSTTVDFDLIENWIEGLIKFLEPPRIFAKLEHTPAQPSSEAKLPH